MPAPTRIPDSLLAIADAQSQVVSRSQALNAGLSPDSLRGLVSAGRWATLTRGIFTTDGMAADRAGWFQWAWCGLLIAGPGSCLGVRAAAYLNGFDDQARPIHVWCPAARSLPRRNRDAGLTTHLRFVRGTRDALWTPPRTSVNRTVLDLCSQEVVQGSANDNSLRSMEAVRVRIEEGVRYGGTTLESLLATLDNAEDLGGSRTRGHGTIRNVLNLLLVQQDQLNGTQSPGRRPIPVDPWWPVLTGPPIRRWSPRPGAELGGTAALMPTPDRRPPANL
ncbi:MAG: type IV toxin-antitoxin system AbiEi family antitoxin domain-containing protein [Acidipropionibacterium sp.]|jgi:hypothetical protein|nr:type IV toxin-antitoxin system AbiEi family antitoxin domain-containing protein [Acidipropionibacterium sp.]